MATKRHGRTGIFKGVSGTSRGRQTSASPRSALVALAGVTYGWDIASDLLTWGPNAAEALGLDPSDLPRTGHAFDRLFEPGSGTSRREAVAEETGAATYHLRYALRFGADRVVMVDDSGRSQPDATGRPAFARGHLRTDLQASTPDLLPARIKARSELLCAIQGDINEALRVSQTCTMIVGAVDEAEVDDLQAVARKLRPMMRRHDHFAVLGPGRFALTLTCCPAADAPSAMRRLAGLLQAHPAGASLTLGAACAPDHTFQATKLLRFAEQAVSAGIARGERAVLHETVYGLSLPAAEQSPFDVIAALNDRRLTLAGQPSVDALSRVLALTQTCAALPGPDGAPVPLGPVPALDDANLALLVDGRMLELAADHLARHPDERLALPIGPATVADPEWLPTLAAHLGARPGIESRLVIEIPETAVLDPEVLGRLNAMKALGIGLSLSGFGTGFVSAVQLRNLPVDLLKIDGVYVQSLQRSSDDRLFVRALVETAHHLGIATMAEWVDDEATARLLAGWGVDYLCGDAFGGLKALAQPPSLLQMIAKRA